MIELYGLIFVFILGTVGHFLYNISKNEIISFIFSKGESIWSHLKLGITPIIIWGLLEKTKLNTKYLFAIKGYQILTFVISLLLFYIVYRLIFKKRNAIYDITSFYISVLLSFVVSFLLINMISLPIIFAIIGYILVIIAIASYFILNKRKDLWITKEPKPEKDN